MSTPLCRVSPRTHQNSSNISLCPYRDYAVKVFGYATFGTVYGAIICLSGLFTFAQSGLQALLHHTFANDPEPINLGLATAGLVLGVVLVMYVDIQGRNMQREKAIAAANEERERRGLLAASQRSSKSGLMNGPPAGGGGGTAGAGGGGGGAGGGVSGQGDDPERWSLLHHLPSRQALERNLSTVQETREV